MGQVAFETWVKRVLTRNPGNRLLTDFPHTWNDLSSEAKEDWEATALALIDAFDLYVRYQESPE